MMKTYTRGYKDQSFGDNKLAACYVKQGTNAGRFLVCGVCGGDVVVADDSGGGYVCAGCARVCVCARARRGVVVVAAAAAAAAGVSQNVEPFHGLSREVL